jgi:2-polyprenyl-3-methyl-5-hydroxy-6-metoxy-1,4-benzoquinol methylase
VGGTLGFLASEAARFLKRRFRYRFAGEMVACPLCGGREHDVVATRDRGFNRLRTVLCRGCGLVMTNPMPTEAEIDAFYRHDYRAAYHGTLEPGAKTLIKAERGARARAARLLPLLRPGMKVLDVGAAEGAFAAQLTRAGFAVTGIEPNEGFARYAAATSGADILIGGWREARLPEAGFDLVTLHHVLEHLREPVAALTRIAGWVKPGGRVQIAVPNLEDTRRSPQARFHFGHLYNYNRTALIAMAAQAGLHPLAGHDAAPTDIVFERRGEAKGPTPDPANYARLRALFDTHTTARHYLSATPYRRFLTRWRRWFADGAAARARSAAAAGKSETRPGG